MACFYAFTFQVKPDEQGVVLRFGQYVRWAPPGLHFRWPYPIEEVRLPRVTEQRITEVGMRTTARAGAGSVREPQPSQTREMERRLATAIASSVIRGRAALGWSKADLARRAGVSAAAMTRIEFASAEHVGLRSICAVLETLGVDARLLLEGPTVLTDRSQHDAVHARLWGHLADASRRSAGRPLSKSR